MESDGDKNLESNTKREYSDPLSNASTVFQPLWLRHNPILAYRPFREYLESQFRTVLYCGAILWAIFIITR